MSLVRQILLKLWMMFAGDQMMVLSHRLNPSDFKHLTNTGRKRLLALSSSCHTVTTLATPLSARTSDERSRCFLSAVKGETPAVSSLVEVFVQGCDRRLQQHSGDLLLHGKRWHKSAREVAAALKFCWPHRWEKLLESLRRSLRLHAVSAWSARWHGDFSKLSLSIYE